MRVRARLVATVGAALAAVSALGACSSGGSPGATRSTVYVTVTPSTRSTGSGPAGSGTGSPGTASPTAGTQPQRAPLGKPVGVSSAEDDGVTYGVGMPLIVRFSKSPTSRAAFEKAASVLVNGKPIAGAWFWERVLRGKPLEAHYRPQHPYWPAHSKIHVRLLVKGLSAGPGLSFSNDLTLDYNIGAYHVSRVDAKTLRMTVYGDTGLPVKLIAVSLGRKSTPTYSGVKVIMAKDNPAHMSGTQADPYHVIVPNAVRVSQDGEYVHPAPWNKHIGTISSSHGCTNVSVADGAWFFAFSQVGDVVEYPETDGKPMPTWNGYGDWNPNWQTWSAGGAL